MGKWLIFFGTLLIITGIALQLGVRFTWFGNLPGDFSFRSGNTHIYFPLTSGIVVSLALSILVYLIRLILR